MSAIGRLHQENDALLCARLKTAYEAACKRSRKYRPLLHDCALSLGLSDGPYDNQKPGDAERLILRLVCTGKIVFQPSDNGLVPTFPSPA